MKRICIVNVVGLTPRLLAHAPNIASRGTALAWQSPFPAVTCTAQATMLTGLLPKDHGIVGNGWYDRDSGEVRFWQQSNRLIQGPKFYEGFDTAKMFWWYNQGAPVRWSATPKPYYGCDGSKHFGILDQTECNLESELGDFPFFTFWGPNAGLGCSQWIAKATASVIRKNRPAITLAYLPHLDYDYQRYETKDPERVAEVDRCAQTIFEAADDINAEVIVVSEYGLVPVSKPVMINQVLRRAGLLKVRQGPFGEVFLPMESTAFAVCDHQLAHVYVNDRHQLPRVRQLLESTAGIDQVTLPEDLDLGHARSGDLIALAQSDAWFCYYFWLDDNLAPDYARTVDIHRKPGYDPCELFMTSRLRAAARLLQKKIGLRYKMDVIPLIPQLVRGSHGLRPAEVDGPLVIGQSPPNSMTDLAEFVRSRLNRPD